MPAEHLNFNSIKRNPLLIVISGPSGVGKDTVVKGIMQRDKNLHFVITTTSRNPREGEVHGVDYYFTTKENFEAMISNNEFIEYALVYEQYKGVAKQQVRDAFASGRDVIMRLDVQGAATMRKLFPEAVLVFLLPSSEEELIFRLKDRGTETEESISLRMATTKKELETLPIFDYFVYNPAGKLDVAVDHLAAIVCAEHNRIHQRKVEI